MSVTSTAFARKRVAIIQTILPTLLQDMSAAGSVGIQLFAGKIPLTPLY